VDEPRLPLRVRYAMFIALTLVGVGIALVTDVGHILAFAPSDALVLTSQSSTGCTGGGHDTNGSKHRRPPRCDDHGRSRIAGVDPPEVSSCGG